MKLSAKRKFEQVAIAVALSGSGCGGRSRRNFRIGAAIFHRNYVLSSAYNSYKTHPKLCKWTKYPCLHAEQAAIFKIGYDTIQTLKGLTLYVARVRKNNDLALAKPCKVCQAIIASTPIEEVYYSTDKGIFLRLI